MEESIKKEWRQKRSQQQQQQQFSFYFHCSKVQKTQKNSIKNFNNDEGIFHDTKIWKLNIKLFAFVHFNQVEMEIISFVLGCRKYISAVALMVKEKSVGMEKWAKKYIN